MAEGGSLRQRYPEHPTGMHPVSLRQHISFKPQFFHCPAPPPSYEECVGATNPECVTRFALSLSLCLSPPPPCPLLSAMFMHNLLHYPSVSPLSQDEARKALLKHVNEKWFVNKSPAIEFDFVDIQSSSAYRVRHTPTVVVTNNFHVSLRT